MQKINLAFLQTPLPQDASWRDRLQAAFERYVVGQFDHVELIFENPENPAYFYACSVLRGGRVFFKERGFSRSGYQFLTVHGLEPEQVNAMRKFCYKEACKGSEFNDSGFYKAFTPFPEKSGRPASREGDMNRWFCSQLLTAALQKGGLLENYVPSTMTPASIYYALLKTVPSKNIHKGTNPFFGYRIQKALRDETTRILEGESVDEPSSDEPTYVEKRIWSWPWRGKSLFADSTSTYS